MSCICCGSVHGDDTVCGGLLEDDDGLEMRLGGGVGDWQSLGLTEGTGRSIVLCALHSTNDRRIWAPTQIGMGYLVQSWSDLPYPHLAKKLEDFHFLLSSELSLRKLLTLCNLFTFLVILVLDLSYCLRARPADMTDKLWKCHWDVQNFMNLHAS